MRERSGSHGGNLRKPRRHYSPAYGRDGTPAGVAQRGGDSGDWTTVSYKRRKAIRPGDRGQDRPRNSSRHGGYKEDRFYSSGRRHQDHSRDSRYFSWDSRATTAELGATAAELGFQNSSSRFHAAEVPQYDQPRSHHHHSRPGIYQHAPSRHLSRTARGTRHLSRAERGRSCTRQALRTRRVSISNSPSANLQGNNSASRASFYVTNLPDQALYVDIRKAFEVCGILSDVYVARNRNARGQNYGFVRFINVKDVAKLRKALNNVYFGQNKVWANVARFDRFGEVKKNC